ncbi:hypothetical protein PMAYCL1PPCAC_31708, partial [Pristionchus mayeri]
SCASWKTNGFCDNTAYTFEQKRASCCTTCFEPVVEVHTPPTTTCALIFSGTTTVEVNASPTTAMEPIPPTTPPTVLSKVSVNAGCTL